MPKITIGNNVINFPETGSDALWSPAIIQFAESVEDKFNAASNPFDIASKVVILNDNASTFTLTAAKFDPADVRKFSFNYAIYRKSNTETKIQSGVFSGIYNTIDSTWTFQDEFFGDRKSDGTPYNTFSLNSSYEVELTTQLINGVYDSVNSTISFSGKTELVST